jgi:heme exporter protein A
MQASGLTAWELFCQRGGRHLFGSLDLWADGGTAIHLVGPNGIGKSSLIRILAGLLRPSPTHFGMEGLPPRGSVHWKGSVGLLDSALPLDEHAALEKSLGFWHQIDRSDSHLHRLGLAELSEVPVRYLSTGQRKRAAFALLLSQRCDHWLLDEPLNGLDTGGATLIEELVAERRAAGGVVVVASHQPIALPGAKVIDLRDYPA